MAAAFTIALAMALHGCGGGGDDPKPQDLTFGCSDPPLGVAYDIPYYSGAVTCGNLLLECDIGGTHPWIPPKVTFPAAEADGLYVMMYIDFFVNLADDGSYPDVKTPGTKAPARHWVAGNIDATMLKSGDLSKATTVSAFKGPSPPWGSHPYAQFLFKQPAAEQIGTFPTYPDPATNATAIYNFDYKAFIEEFGLGAPVASNWHVTQHIDPCPTHNVSATTKARSTSTQKSPKSKYPDPALTIGCSDPPLQAAYNIEYYNGTVNCGNLLLENDIGGGKTVQPTVTFPSAEDGFYTLAYIDPDANLVNGSKNVSWPDEDGPGSAAPVRHWVAGNIDAAMLKSGNLSGAFTVSPYKGPSPPWGSHRYGLFLFKQNGSLSFAKMEFGVDWDYNSFINNYSLGSPIASNWHTTQHDVARPMPTTVLSI